MSFVIIITVVHLTIFKLGADYMRKFQHNRPGWKKPRLHEIFQPELKPEIGSEPWKEYVGGLRRFGNQHLPRPANHLFSPGWNFFMRFHGIFSLSWFFFPSPNCHGSIPYNMLGTTLYTSLKFLAWFLYYHGSPARVAHTGLKLSSCNRELRFSSILSECRAGILHVISPLIIGFIRHSNFTTSKHAACDRQNKYLAC